MNIKLYGGRCVQIVSSGCLDTKTIILTIKHHHHIEFKTVRHYRMIILSNTDISMKLISFLVNAFLVYKYSLSFEKIWKRWQHQH